MDKSVIPSALLMTCRSAELKRSQVQFSQLVMYIRQTSHSTLCLPTQQWWVPCGWKLCLSGPSCLHTCMTCELYSPRRVEIVQVMCVQYQEKATGWLNIVQISDLKLCTFYLYPRPGILGSSTSHRSVYKYNMVAGHLWSLKYRKFHCAFSAITCY